MATEREYLHSIGLAKLLSDNGKPARGKFSREGVAALEKAKGEGMTFDLPAYKVAQAAKPATEGAVAPAPKAPRVIVAPEAVKPSPPPIPLALPSEQKAEAKTNKALWAVSGNNVVRYRSCGRCRISVVDCTCPTGPQAPAGFAPIAEKDAFV